MSKLIVVTASGLSREVLATVEARGDYDVIGFLDDEPALLGIRISGLPVLGSIADAARFSDTAFVVSAGHGQTRQHIVDRLAAQGVGDDRYATIIDPTVRLPRTSSVGVGSIILAECVLTADVFLGRHVVAMPHVTLTHDDQVSDFATLCAGVSLGGGVHVERAAYLGMNASVRERLFVGANSTLGMGSVLLENLPAGETWAGCPAHFLQDSRFVRTNQSRSA
jgi:sugar O-acyltransferase (sialic acid O-acetyltransferase NeuD family)